MSYIKKGDLYLRHTSSTSVINFIFVLDVDLYKGTVTYVYETNGRRELAVDSLDGFSNYLKDIHSPTYEVNLREFL